MPGGVGIPGGSCLGNRSELEEPACPTIDGVVPSFGLISGSWLDLNSRLLFFASGPSDELEGIIARLRPGGIGKWISLG